MSDHHLRSQLLSVHDAFVAGFPAPPMNYAYSKDTLAPSSAALVASDPRTWQPSCYNLTLADASNALQETKIHGASIESPFSGSLQSYLGNFAHVSASHLQQAAAASQTSKDWSACRPLWMQEPVATLNSMDALRGMQPNSSMPDQPQAALEVELSRRLGGTDACLASAVAECLEPGMQQRQSLASAWMSALNMRARFMDPGAPSIINSHEPITHYAFDPAFAERAAKFSSFTGKKYSCFGNSTQPTLDDRGRCVDGSSFSPSAEGPNSPRKLVGSSSSPSQGLSSPPADRRVVSFALAPTLAKAPKPEILDDCTSAGGNFEEDDDKKLNSSGSQICSPPCNVPEKGRKLQQCEPAKALDESTSASPGSLVHSPRGDAKAQDGSRTKRRRLEDGEEKVGNVKSMPPTTTTTTTTDGRDVKGADHILDAPPKTQKCAPAKTEEEKGKVNDSGGESSPVAGKEKPTKPAEPPKPDFIHVRARRGQATDSHSLAERVRREKISERMRFLQDLVPGCSKITGKAMMLDEIINYVQSLQHQVEFLAMKLAAMNPRLDFNFESFLEGEIASAAAAEVAVVPEMATSAGPMPNYQMLRASLALRDPANYCLPITNVEIPTDDCSPSCTEQQLPGANRSGFSHQGSSWDGSTLAGRNLGYEEQMLLASADVYHK